MKNYYSTVNSIILTYSDIIDNDLEMIQVRFERATEKGFDFAEGSIPHFIFNKTFGFSEDELLQLERYLRNNASLLWDMAREREGVSIGQRITE